VTIEIRERCTKFREVSDLQGRGLAGVFDLEIAMIPCIVAMVSWPLVPQRGIEMMMNREFKDAK